MLPVESEATGFSPFIGEKVAKASFGGKFSSGKSVKMAHLSMRYFFYMLAKGESLSF